MAVNTDKIEGISWTQDISYIFENGASRLFTAHTYNENPYTKKSIK